MHCKVFYRLWALLEEQLDHNITHCCVDRRLLSEWILSPDRCCHSGILFGWLLVKDISTIVCSALRWFTLCENKESLLIVRSAYCERIYCFFTVIFSFNNRNSLFYRLLHW